MTDVTNQQTFDGIDMWLREVSKHGGEKLPTVIVGNKSDLGSQRQVNKADASQWAKKHHMVGYFETSAKEKTGFFDLMKEIVENINSTQS